MAEERTVRLGFVGAGYMGQLAHLENYWKLPDVELVALAEGRAKTAARVAQVYGIDQCFPDHRRMLAEAKIDAVVAVLPFALNAPVVLDCLDAGRHVITEKPQTYTSAVGRDLVDLARRRNVVYQVGYMKRFDPGVIWVKKAIEQWKQSGEFGPMLSLRIWCAMGQWQWFREPAINLGDAAPPYDLKLESRPAGMDEASWKMHGHWTNYYSHQTNLARYVAGEDYTLTSARRLDTTANPSFFVGASFDQSGAQLSLEFTAHHHPHWDEGFEIRFERATVKVQMPAPLARGQCADVQVTTCPRAGGAMRYSPELPVRDGFAAQAASFIASIRGTEPALSPAAEAVKEVEFSERLMAMLSGK